jgi:small subunit ribosomal protein S2
MSEEQGMAGEQELLLPLEQLLAAGLHIGTRIKTEHMEPFIYRVRPDGLFILNVGETDKRLRVAAKFIARFDPPRVLAVSSRLYGHTPVRKFSEVTGAKYVVGRFLPGYISNPSHPYHLEPQVLVATDPRADWQAISEASSAGIPVIALCDTDNTFAKVDLAIPTNNKGRRALATVYWLLARQVLRERGVIPRDGEISYTIDDFETKLTAAVQAGARLEG